MAAPGPSKVTLLAPSPTASRRTGGPRSADIVPSPIGNNVSQNGTSRPGSPQERWARVRGAVLAGKVSRASPLLTEKKSTWDVRFTPRAKPKVHGSDAERFVSEVVAARTYQAGLGRDGQQARLQTTHEAPSSPASQLPALQRLAGVLERYKSLGSLPNATLVLSELFTPFVESDRLDEQCCTYALDLFAVVRHHFRALSADEELSRWLWCCRVAAVARGQLLDRALSQLKELLGPARPVDTPRPDTPLALQTLTAALVHTLSALVAMGGEEGGREAAHTVHQLLGQVADGRLISLEASDGYEVGGRRLSSMDTAKLAHLESVVRVISAGATNVSRFAVFHLLNASWLSPLLIPADVLLRLLGQLSVSFTRLQRPADDNEGVIVRRQRDDKVSNAVLDFLRRQFPASVLQSLPKDAQKMILACFLSLMQGLSVDQYSNQHWPAPPPLNLPEHVGLARDQLHTAWAAGMDAPLLEAAAVLAVEKSRDPGTLGFLCLALRPEISKPIAERCLPALLESLATAEPATKLTDLLMALAARHTQLFYKPLFACAASNKAETVRKHLRTLRSVAAHIKPLRFYLRDAEMLSVAIASLAATATAAAKTASWSHLRLGQQAICAELIALMRGLRSEQLQVSDAREVRTFADSFEPKVERLLASRERNSLLSIRDRMLLSTLLLEIQLVSAASRRPVWFDRAVRWAATSHAGAIVSLDTESSTNPFLQDERPSLRVSEDDVSQAGESLEALAALLHLPAASNQVTHRASTSIADLATKAQDPVDRTSQLVGDLAQQGAAPLLSLVSGLYPALTDEDLSLLVEPVWTEHLVDSAKAAFLPAVFLLMQAGDRQAAPLTTAVKRDMGHGDSTVRLSAIRKLANVFAARFSVLAVPLPEKLRKRPFRAAARQQIAFVPTDMGMPTYVAPPRAEANANVGASLPMEIREALMELGWDEESSQQTASERQQLPLRVLPLAQVATKHVTSEQSGSVERPASPLLRRNSSSKRMGGASSRQILVGPVAALMLEVTNMMRDKDASVANAALDAIMLFLRDDPLLVLRPVLEQLSGTIEGKISAVTLLDRMLLLADRLPPALVHHAFNHLAGLARTESREGQGGATQVLMMLTSLMPATCKIAATVPDMSIRQIRKNKAEPLLLSSGQLWFSDPDPVGPGLPRAYPGDGRSFQRLDLPSSVFAIVAMRTAQNSFLADLMSRRTDAENFWRIKQSLKPLNLPMNDRAKPLTSRDYVPTVDGQASGRHSAARKGDFQAASRMLARSHLQMILALVSGLSHHLNDLAELERIYEGVNRILLVHGSTDVDIALFAVRCCLLGSIRFQRLFSSGNGFSVFLPALFKVYCTTAVPAVSAAIEYAWIAFYARHEHQESFVFQSLASLASVIASPEVSAEASQLAQSKLFQLLRCLDAGLDAAPGSLLAGTTEKAEREAAMRKLNEAPESILAPLLKKNGEETRKPTVVRQIQSRFPLEDVIRLCLTAITFEPTTSRALSFLRLLRLLTPPLHGRSSAVAALLKEGVEALAAVFAKQHAPSRGKALGALMNEVGGAPDPSQQLGWASSRQACLFLVETYLQCGGEMSAPAMRHVLELLKSVLRSAGPSAHLAGGSIMQHLTSAICSSKAPSDVVSGFLRDFSPTFGGLVQSVGFAPFLDALATAMQPGYALADPRLQMQIINSFLIPAAAAIIQPASSGLVLQALQTSTARLVAAIAALGNGDALVALEQQERSTMLIARLVLPLLAAMTKASSAALAPFADQKPTGRVYLRLATLISRTMDANPSSATVLLGSQALKIIAFSGAAALTSVPGAWPALAGILRAQLHRGGVGFLSAFPPSPPSSRSASPVGRHDRSPSVDQRGAMPSPRAVDYAFWSLAELLLLSASPLMVHLRITLHEKVDQARVPTGGGGRSRSRRRSRSPSTAAASPRPLLNRSLSRSQKTPSPSLAPSRMDKRSSFAVFDRAYRAIEPREGSPSPSPMETTFPRIQHLGLAHSPTKTRSGVEQAPLSPALVEQTLQRLRRVQIMMGEQPISHPLSLTANEDDEESRMHALAAHEILKRLDGETALIVTEMGV